MRTAAEIVQRIKESKSFFGFEQEALIPYLTFEQARPFLKSEAKSEEWKPFPLTEESVRAEMAAYMLFAWEKALDHRGLSAGRSVEKLSAWIWLLGDDVCLSLVEAAEHTNYGAPKLQVICDAFGLPMPDDEAARRMARGLPCRDDCDEGCGS